MLPTLPSLHRPMHARALPLLNARHTAPGTPSRMIPSAPQHGIIVGIIWRFVTRAHPSLNRRPLGSLRQVGIMPRSITSVV
ncbi:MAG: hypothetical protein KF716_17465 [Anaerolineae bacterium]|nr:hypothetical protein [Anaerolineae bacterium]